MKQGDKVIYKDLSYKIVGVLYDIYNELGYGLREKYYENAIAQSFDKLKIRYSRQASYLIRYRGAIIGRQFVDFIVEDKIVLELKKGNYFSRNNIEQIKSYLVVTGLKLALLAHFTSNGVKVFRALNPNNN